ncbi:hypothetical protein RRG08_014144 [Elysia crispata]|uniref:Uncharacterized protein n=1 Tax=Elysia crispata TaxID=231223 RepID=A0AAE1AIT3_9GAST|nr:hypothetical protein RRG08_014144 [Elysia crispata]
MGLLGVEILGNPVRWQLHFLRGTSSEAREGVSGHFNSHNLRMSNSLSEQPWCTAQAHTNPMLPVWFDDLS